MNKKYAFTGKCKEILDGVFVHQICALRNVNENVRSGDLGGWIEKESNLSHDGLCWVNKEAVVYGDAHIYENAQILQGAFIMDNAHVHGDVKLSNIIVPFNADISCDWDFLYVGPLGTHGKYLLFYHSKDDDVFVYGEKINNDLNKFMQKVVEFSNTKEAENYKLAVELAKRRILWRGNETCAASK